MGKPSFVFLTSGHSDAQCWVSVCPDVKITNEPGLAQDAL